MISWKEFITLTPVFLRILFDRISIDMKQLLPLFIKNCEKVLYTESKAVSLETEDNEIQDFLRKKTTYLQISFKFIKSCLNSAF